MKSLTILVISIILIANTDLAKAQVQVSSDVTFSVFHENLMAYGRWVDHPNYGQVWIPDEQGFVPYRTNGHWAYTEDGWTWVSDYDWGWAPFHYGRWDYDDTYGGYFWVPGYDWGPAWVSWRRNNDVYGWAPLSPNMNIGIGISFGDEIPVNRWTFVSPQYIAQPHISRYYVDSRRNVTIINNTTIINNVHQNNYHTVIVGGPGRSEVEHYTHSRINTYTVNNSSRPNVTNVNKNTINIYRPVVNKTTVQNKTVISNIQKNIDIHNRARINNNQRFNVDQGAKGNIPNNTITNRSPGVLTPKAATNPSLQQPPQQRPQDNQQRPAVNRTQQQPPQQRPQDNQQRPAVNRTQQQPPQQRPQDNQQRPAVNRMQQQPPQHPQDIQQRPAVNRTQQQQPQQRPAVNRIPPPQQQTRPPSTNPTPQNRKPEEEKRP
jgi:hypothetical protein